MANETAETASQTFEYAIGHHDMKIFWITNKYYRTNRLQCQQIFSSKPTFSLGTPLYGLLKCKYSKPMVF